MTSSKRLTLKENKKEIIQHESGKESDKVVQDKDFGMSRACGHGRHALNKHDRDILPQLVDVPVNRLISLNSAICGTAVFRSLHVPS